MKERLAAEIELLRSSGWEVEVSPEFDWIIVKDVPLPEGWNRTETDVLIKIRAGYPTTPPDNFYTHPELRLANGSKPGNAPNEETIGGRQWLTFSYHLHDGWDPHAEPDQGHNLLTYFQGVRNRLAEVS